MHYIPEHRLRLGCRLYRHNQRGHLARQRQQLRPNPPECTCHHQVKFAHRYLVATRKGVLHLAVVSLRRRKPRPLGSQIKRIARAEADVAAAKAREATDKAAPTDLAAREEAERYIDDAIAANAHAKAAAKDRGSAKGGARAVTLRSVWTGTITDLTACAGHYWHTDKEALQMLIAQMVHRDVRAGKRDIPGVDITEERVAQ